MRRRQVKNSSGKPDNAFIRSTSVASLLLGSYWSLTNDRAKEVENERILTLIFSLLIMDIAIWLLMAVACRISCKQWHRVYCLPSKVSQSHFWQTSAPQFVLFSSCCHSSDPVPVQTPVI